MIFFNSQITNYRYILLRNWNELDNETNEILQVYFHLQEETRVYFTSILSILQEGSQSSLVIRNYWIVVQGDSSLGEKKHNRYRVVLVKKVNEFKLWFVISSIVLTGLDLIIPDIPPLPRVNKISLLRINSQVASPIVLCQQPSAW